MVKFCLALGFILECHSAAFLLRKFLMLFNARLIVKAVKIVGTSVLSTVDTDPVLAAVMQWGSV